MSEKLFFGVFPDPGTAQEIADFATSFREANDIAGSAIAARRLHVTIEFLGNYPSLPDSLVTFVSRAADRLDFKPFTASFDQVISFKGNDERKPLVLVSDEGALGLGGLRRALSDAFEAQGMSPLSESFTPHITLSYADSTIEPQPAGRFSFEVKELVLIRSLVGQARYIPLGRWRLG